MRSLSILPSLDMREARSEAERSKANLEGNQPWDGWDGATISEILKGKRLLRRFCLQLCRASTSNKN